MSKKFPWVNIKNKKCSHRAGGQRGKRANMKKIEKKARDFKNRENENQPMTDCLPQSFPQARSQPRTEIELKY